MSNTLTQDDLKELFEAGCPFIARQNYEPTVFSLVFSFDHPDITPKVHKAVKKGKEVK